MSIQIKAEVARAILPQRSNIKEVYNAAPEAAKKGLNVQDRINLMEKWLSNTLYQVHNSNKPSPDHGAGNTFRNK